MSLPRNHPPGLRVSFASIMMLTVASLAGEPALADGPAIGQDAGAFFPLENDSVQLVAEEVEIYLPSSLTNPVGPAGLRHGLAKCTYHLRNLTTTAQEFEMAFVIQGPAPSWMQTDKVALCRESILVYAG